MSAYRRVCRLNAWRLDQFTAQRSFGVGYGSNFTSLPFSLLRQMYPKAAIVVGDKHLLISQARSQGEGVGRPPTHPTGANRSLSADCSSANISNIVRLQCRFEL